MSKTTVAALTDEDIARAHRLAEREGKPVKAVLARFARYDAYDRSREHLELAFVVRLTWLAAQLADRWADEHGADDCKCPACKHLRESDIAGICDDLRVAAYNGRNSIGFVGNFTHASPEFRFRTFAEAVAHLAADAEAIDAAADPKPAAAPRLK